MLHLQNEYCISCITGLMQGTNQYHMVMFSLEKNENDKQVVVIKKI